MEIGIVKNVKNFLIHLDGLPTIKTNELVENEAGVRGWVSALLPDTTEVLIIDDGSIEPGQVFKRVGKQLTVPTGDFLLGRAINPLGVPIDGKAPLSANKNTKQADLDTPALGISAREFITNQFHTGITLIDSLIPLGNGQRELIMGDARSGKTEFLINIITNQSITGVICIYASIGKPIAQVKNIIDTLKKRKALAYTCIIATSSSDPAPLIFLTPQTAFTVAEYFQRQGKNVLLILDDIGNHAKIHREISLLSNRPPGRESYPGDIFYQHAHLLERAGNFKKEFGGGSITALPIIELNLNDFTTLIPTNLMGMTDGHLLFRSTYALQGQRPAIDITLSVSRVGAQTQNRALNKMATKVKQTLAEARDLETVSRFSFELPFATQLILRQKDQFDEILKQTSFSYVPEEIQAILLALPYTKFMADKGKDFVAIYKDKIIQAFLADPELLKTTKSVLLAKNDQLLINLVNQATTRLAKLILPPLPAVALAKASPPPPIPKKESLLEKIEEMIHIKGK
ncbi:MAG: F0F1 ATP synthase subunit alpha [Candidatus Daviesbacteria bacterium]|nr:F0F1 ATP synthase subunit alpha [Candidatus Daviesbacteria bacterium]